MARINLNLRDPRSRDASPINVVVRWNGQRLVYPSGERVIPRHWSATSQTVKRSLTGSPEFNERLEAITGKVATAYRQFVNDNDQRQPSVGELRQRIAGALNPQPDAQTGEQTLFQFIDAHIEGAQQRMKAGELAGDATLSKYRTTREHLRNYCKAKRFALDWDTVDHSFYLRFVAYLTADKGMSTNTVGKYIRTLKTFLNAAQDERPDRMPMYRSRKFRTPSELTDKIYLTAQELNDLFHLDLSSNRRLEQVRDLFIVGAWTGLRYSDWASITPEQVTGDRIRIGTVKTKEKVTIPVHPCVRAILTKYGNALPRVPSNQKINDYLKELAALVPCLQEPVTISHTVAGVEVSETKAKAELVTTHTARRSFATNAYRGDGYRGPVPVRVIMAITGHRTEKTFQVYIRMDADDHADEFAKYMPAPLAVVA